MKIDVVFSTKSIAVKALCIAFDKQVKDLNKSLRLNTINVFNIEGVPHIKRKDAVLVVCKMIRDTPKILAVKKVMKKSTKLCGGCEKKLELSNFSKKGDRLQASCKSCQLSERKDFNHTREGLVSIMYTSQKKRSKLRGHPAPSYTKKEFTEWVFDNKDFESLFMEWSYHNFEVDYVPSVDRTNCKLPYTMDNITLMTWDMNREKGYEERYPTKDIYVDADYLIYECTEGKDNKASYFNSESGSVRPSDHEINLEPYKDKLKAIVKKLEDDVALETVSHKFKLGKTHLVFTGDNNFRYDIYPEYKANREGKVKAPEFEPLRKWAMEKYMCLDNVEADDVCSYYARKGHLIVSADKDVRKSNEGIFFNPHYMHRNIVITTKDDASRFNLIQTITGDATDNIPALPKNSGNDLVYGVPTPGIRKPFKVTEKLAIELLDNYGWDFDGVVSAFVEKGFGEEEAILNRRLTGMDQWDPKKGVTLWEK